MLVPVNTRFKGAEAADILRAQRGPRAGDGHRLPRHRLRRHARRHRRRPPRPRHHRGRPTVRRRPAADGVGRLPRPGRPPRRGPRSTRRGAAVGPDDPSDILFTSGTTGVPEGRRPDPRSHAARGHRLGGDDRPHRRRPLPHGQPLLPHVRAEGRHPRLGRRRRDDAARGRCSTSTGCWPGSPTEQVTVLPGRADALPVASSTTPTAAGHDLSSLRVAVTGAADIPVELIRRIDEELPFSMIITGYGLTEGGTAAATSPDDDVETIATTVGRPRPGFELRIVDGEGGDVAAGRAGRDPAARRQHHVALPRRSRGDRRGAVRRRVAAHRRPRRDRRRRLPAHRRSVEGHVHRRRVQRLPGRDRERAAAPPRRPAGRGDRHPRRAPGRGRHGLRRRCARASTSAAAEIIGGAASRWPTTRCPAWSRSSTSCPLNATGKVDEGRRFASGPRRPASGSAA